MDKSNLIVNYLQTNVSEEDLNRLFSEYGRIQSLKIVRDKGTGISMGFGFVNFESNEAADLAAESLNGLELHGKRIKVSVARPAWKANIHSNLYIANLPTAFTEGDVLNLVGSELAIHIEHVRMLKNSETANAHSSVNEFRGVAVARFDTEESAMAALDLVNSMAIESPTNPNFRCQIHAKPWRPEFRPERAAGVPMVPRQMRPRFDSGATYSRRGSMDSEDNILPPYKGYMQPPRMFKPSPSWRGGPMMSPPGGVAISENEEAILMSSFEQFGAMPGVHVYGDRSWGFVRFPNSHAAYAAVNKLTGFNVNGKILELEAAV